MLDIRCFYSRLNAFSTYGRSVIRLQVTSRGSTTLSSRSSRSSSPPTSVRPASPRPHHPALQSIYFRLTKTLPCLTRAAQMPTQKRSTSRACHLPLSTRSRPTPSGVSRSCSTGSRTTTSSPSPEFRGASRRWRSWSGGSIVSLLCLRLGKHIGSDSGR
jgi:hypothetical protein